MGGGSRKRSADIYIYIEAGRRNDSTRETSGFSGNHNIHRSVGASSNAAPTGGSVVWARIR